MPKRWNLTLYRIRETIEGKQSDFLNVLRDPKAVKAHDPVQSSSIDFDAKLILSVSKADFPAWSELFDDDFDDLKIPKVRRVDGLLLVRVPVQGKSPLFAFSFGQGRHLLKPEAIFPSHGLHVAINAVYRDAKDTAQIRSVDSKSIDQTVFNTRRQADRRTSFESFRVDTRHDFLRSIVGKPHDANLWGTRLSGSHGLTANPEVDFRDLGSFCKTVYLTHVKGTPDEFAWIQTLQPVDDTALKTELLEKMIEVLSTKDDLSFAVPEVVDWDDIAHFSVSCLPEQKFIDPEDFSLKDSLAALEKPKKITIGNLRKWKLEAFDLKPETVHSWSLISCLSGQLELNGKVFVVSGGEFFLVEKSYLKALYSFVGGIEATAYVLPTAEEDPPEGEYNALAANSSDSFLLLDKKTVKLTSQTSPIEACDLLTTDGAFIHVKRKLGSSSLSHLFAQGSVSADLLLMSQDFRTALDKKIEAAEIERAEATGDNGFKNRFPRTTAKTVNPKDHEIVYAVAASWKGRTLAQALPFFSKINLRRHVEELTRMGYKVTFAQIEATPRPKAE